MRRDNRALDRAFAWNWIFCAKSFLTICRRVSPISIFKPGEDPIAVREIIIPLIREIRQRTKLGVSVCLGTLEEKLYRELRQAGAEFYIIKLETGNEKHYQQVQAPGTLSSRLKAIENLAADGWFVSSGFIHGLPHQTEEHIIETLQRLSNLPLVGNSVSPFIPGSGTPSASYPSPDLETTLNLLAAMRLLNPNRIIPAVSAMSILHQNGYKRALRAGANLTTINLTPEGSRENYLLYKKDRFIMNEQRASCKAVEAARSEVKFDQPGGLSESAELT